MSDKRMLIVGAEVLRRVDENRGDMDHSDFISFLLDSCLMEDLGKPNYVTKEDFNDFQQGTKELLRNFLDFFLSYGLELGKQPEDKAFEELTQKLQVFSDSASKAKNP